MKHKIVKDMHLNTSAKNELNPGLSFSGATAGRMAVAV